MHAMGVEVKREHEKGNGERRRNIEGLRRGRKVVNLELEAAGLVAEVVMACL